MAVTVQSADITEAESLLLALVRERYPDIDLGPASAIRELGLKTIAPGLALVLATARDFTNRLSFTTLTQLTDDEAYASANALAANLFVTRRSATRAGVTGRVYFTTNTAHRIPAGVAFVRDSVAFRLLGGTELTVAAGDLKAVLEGTTSLYYVDLAMETFSTGVGSNTTLGVFQSVTPFANDFYRAEVVSTPAGGVPEETTAELIARIPTALTTRNLVNRRAVTHSLLERFPDVSNVLVVGAGDAEMERDVALDNNVSLRFHTGGATDVYVDTDVEMVTETITVGTTVTRADGKIVVMKVASGDLALAAAATEDLVLSVGGSLYLVTDVDATMGEVEIYARTPFPQIDTADITFTLGTLAPTYSNYGTFTGRRTNQVTTVGSVAIQGPVYKVRSAWRLRDAVPDLEVTGSLVRGTGASALTAQSPRMLTVLTDATNLQDGDEVEITYDRPIRIGEVNTYLNDPLNRTVCADVIGRARHPVYVSATIYYEAAGTTYTPTTAAAALTAALSEADEVCEGDIVRALTGATCVKLRTFGATMIKPDGTSAALTVDADTGKLVLPAMTADVSGRTVRFLFDPADITLEV